MKIHIKELTIEISDPCIGRAAIATTPAPSNIPKTGDVWPNIDGIYAGISRDEDGEPVAHLVLLNATSDKDMNWQDAKTWAEGAGGRLPTRFESALLYANVRDKLDKERAHWTGTQRSSSTAWAQRFTNGLQDNFVKGSSHRARAVSRFPL